MTKYNLSTEANYGR